jgi:hypothetical protein
MPMPLFKRDSTSAVQHCDDTVWMVCPTRIVAHLLVHRLRIYMTEWCMNYGYIPWLMMVGSHKHSQKTRICAVFGFVAQRGGSQKTARLEKSHQAKGTQQGCWLVGCLKRQTTYVCVHGRTELRGVENLQCPGSSVFNNAMRSAPAKTDWEGCPTHYHVWGIGGQTVSPSSGVTTGPTPSPA